MNIMSIYLLTIISIWLIYTGGYIIGKGSTITTLIIGLVVLLVGVTLNTEIIINLYKNDK